ncbi:MAG: alginate O-acetyltransferase AlgF [Rhizobiaceae bacterium]|jgi:alginate O-acetyltransferase complex protein AlgF|nr:alginate O-acetyltransferase AlgF [Rhizobiaceae bacterium]
MIRRSVLCGALLLAVFHPSARAQDAGLYDAPPPPGSAFVRVLRAAGDEANAMVGPETLAIGTGISPYAVVKGGELALALGAQTGSVTVEPGRFYSVAMGGEMGPVLFEDPAIDNPAKSAVYFYNLGPAAASVFAPKQTVDVIAAVQPGQSGSRMINAVTLDLDVISGGQTMPLAGVVLERRTGTSIAVLADGSVVVVKNSVAP